MPEVTVKYKNKRTLKALKSIAKILDFEVEETSKKSHRDYSELPVTLAKKPNFKALQGIWKDKDISQETLRKKAWGGRA